MSLPLALVAASLGVMLGNPYYDDYDEFDEPDPVEAPAVLDDDAYGFCHDPEYPLLFEERDWCALVEEGSERCPAFAEVCAGDREASLAGTPGRLSKRTASKSETPTERGRGGGPRRSEQPEPAEIEVPALGGIGQILFWIIIIGAVIALIAAIASNRGPSRPDEDDELPPDPGDDPDVRRAEAARLSMETDVSRLLAMARDAAARQEFTLAVDLGHAALLRRLDHEDLIRLHRGRTNGDYVRDLRGKTEFFGPVRDALRSIDRAQFSDEAPTRGTFDGILSRVESIVRKAGPLIILLGIFGLACDSIAPKEYPWRYSPSGNQGIIDLLEELDVTAGYRGTSLEPLGDEEPDFSVDRVRALVMLADADASAEEWEGIERWVSDHGGTLIIAGGALPPWLAGVRYDDQFSSKDPITVSENATVHAWVPQLSVPPSRFVSGPGWTELERDGRRYGIGVSRGMGRVYVLADDSLFTNASLAVGDNGLFLGQWLESAANGGRVELVDAWAQAGADDPLESVSNSHLTPAILQLMALILVLYLWRGRHFGKPRDPTPPSRQSFVLHARAMGQQYGRARASHHAAKAYSLWVLDRLRDQFPLAARNGLSGIAAALSRRSGRDETDVMRLLVEAHSAMSGATDGSPEEELKLIRDLGRLLRESRGNV